MSFLHAVLLGLIQGVAEFLPISSSGHLAIVEQLLGVEGASEFPGFFDVLLHLGTLAAVFVAYWPEIRDMIVEFFRGIDDLAHGTTPTAGTAGQTHDSAGDLRYITVVCDFAGQGLDRGPEQQSLCCGGRAVDYVLSVVYI